MDYSSGGGKMTIAVLRAKNKISQAELARLLKVSRPTIARWERDVNEMRLIDLKRMAAIFAVNWMTIENERSAIDENDDDLGGV